MNTRLCKVSSGHESDWSALYERVFHDGDRLSVGDLRKSFHAGKRQLHKTSSQDGQLACFSIITVLSEVAFLNYLAEDESKRSLRAPAKHMRQLIADLKARTPSLHWLIVPVPSKTSELSADAQKKRANRLAFFRRLGAKPLRTTIALPGLKRNSEPHLVELLFIGLGDASFSHAKLGAAIKELYKSFESSSASAKTPSLTADQLSRLSLAKRSDAQNDDWISLYIDEFPPEERRDVCQLRHLVKSGRLYLHETRTHEGQLLTWSISQRYALDKEVAFWLGAWTVTRRSAQSAGLGGLHFPKVIAALKEETPEYLGRLTEIESAEGLSEDSQPARRARFYKKIGLKALAIPYEFPLYQPADATEYIPQAKLGKGIKAQLLIAPFSDEPISGKQVRAIVRRIYELGYNVRHDDPYIEERLALIDENRENYLEPIPENWLPAKADNQ